MKNLIRPLQDGFSSLYLSCYNGWTNSPESLDELIGIRKIVLLNIWGNAFYLIEVIDASKSSNRISKKKYHFLKYQNSWQEIKSEDFPKQIAIANIFLGSIYGPYEEEKPDNLNQAIDDFKNTLTASLWLRLEKGLDYYQTYIPGYKINEQFLIDFRKKYIDPFWANKNYLDYMPKIKKK